MPRSSVIEEELDDGSFLARSVKPLQQFSGTSSIHSSLVGNRNRKRNYGGKEAASTPFEKTSRYQEKKTSENSRADALRHETSTIEDEPCTSGAVKSLVMVTGTITRGRRHDQIVEVQFELPEKELKRLNSKQISESTDRSCTLGVNRGPHIVLFTLLFSPFAFLASIFTTFYVGTLCWYNIYLYVSEERTIWHKIFFCPLLLLIYPVLITTSTVFLSLYATLKQISWCLVRWACELRDFDKGFFVWLCNALNISQCSPYEVVVLDESQIMETVTAEQQGTQLEPVTQSL